VHGRQAQHNSTQTRALEKLFYHHHNFALRLFGGVVCRKLGERAAQDFLVQFADFARNRDFSFRATNFT
jgi:hypothetical protein